MKIVCDCYNATCCLSTEKTLEMRTVFNFECQLIIKAYYKIYVLINVDLNNNNNNN